MIKIIINPNNKDVLIKLSQLERLLKEKKINYKIIKEIEVYQNDFNKIEDIIVIGGDGTINKVINNYINKNIIYLPSGSGNDLGKSLSLSLKISDVYNILMEENIVEYDVGKVNKNKFLSGFDIGFNADVIKEINGNYKFKKYFKKYSYFICGLKTVIAFKKYYAKIKIDNEYIETNNLRMLNVMIQKYQGGGVKFSQKATGKSGKLNVMLMYDMNIIIFLYNYLCILLKKHHFMKNVIRVEANTIEIECNQSHYQIDGEFKGNNEKLYISCLPNNYKIKMKKVRKKLNE